MIKSLGLTNFKSIREASIKCGKVNVFIGGPDTGKTNFLEALGLLSCLSWGRESLAKYLRLFSPYFVHNLFFRGMKENPIVISCDGHVVEGRYVNNESLQILCRQETNPNAAPVRATASIHSVGPVLKEPALQAIRFYRPVEALSAGVGGEGQQFLLPPDGQNLGSLIAGNVEGIQDYAQSLLEHSGLKLMFDQFHNQWAVADVQEKAFMTYSLNSLSDTYKRMIFYVACLKTASKSVVVMDEPDVFAFPPYPKMLGEMIALDDRANQFFLTTHNPYFLMALLSKTKQEDLRVFLTSRKPDGSTGIKDLSSPDQLQNLLELDADVFFNTDRL